MQFVERFTLVHFGSLFRGMALEAIVKIRKRKMVFWGTRGLSGEGIVIFSHDNKLSPQEQ